jgi:hypothetical protein
VKKVGFLSFGTGRFEAVVNRLGGRHANSYDPKRTRCRIYAHVIEAVLTKVAPAMGRCRGGAYSAPPISVEGLSDSLWRA